MQTGAMLTSSSPDRTAKDGRFSVHAVQIELSSITLASTFARSAYSAENDLLNLHAI
jgi:hypothetical protein